MGLIVGLLSDFHCLIRLSEVRAVTLFLIAKQDIYATKDVTVQVTVTVLSIFLVNMQELK